MTSMTDGVDLTVSTDTLTYHTNKSIIQVTGRQHTVEESEVNERVRQHLQLPKLPEFGIRVKPGKEHRLPSALQRILPDVRMSYIASALPDSVTALSNVGPGLYVFAVVRPIPYVKSASINPASHEVDERGRWKFVDFATGLEGYDPGLLALKAAGVHHMTPASGVDAVLAEWDKLKEDAGVEEE